jgi:hypothetical protein
MIMPLSKPMSRRGLLGASALGMLALTLPARAQEALPEIAISKDPNCGCCGLWADHLKAAGFPVRVTDATDLRSAKLRLGVPGELASCHTATVGNYVIEGHVPASAIKRLLQEMPQGRGLAVPGMPIGSPGMEGGEPEVYEVMLFGAEPARPFARYRGGDLLADL